MSEISRVGRDRLSERGNLALVIAIALACGFVLTLLTSAQPLRAFHVLLTGAMPEIRWSAQGIEFSRVGRLATVVEETITLSLLGLAILIGFRARQFSLGADGQFFLAALAATFVSVKLGGIPWLGFPAAMLAALLVGLVFGAIPGVLKAYLSCNEIVTTLMLNVVAVQLYRYVITTGFNEAGAGFLVTPRIPAALLFAPLISGTAITAFLFVVPLAVCACWFLINRTVIGYEMRVVADNPWFARQAGIPLVRPVILSMALGGAFAGLAGLHVSNALLKQLPVDMSPGIGLEGLVVALLARNDPKIVPIAAFLYAYLKTGAQVMERTTDVPKEMVLVIQACIVLCFAASTLVEFQAGTRLRDLMRRGRRKAASKAGGEHG